MYTQARFIFFLCAFHLRFRACFFLALASLQPTGPQVTLLLQVQFKILLARYSPLVPPQEIGRGDLARSESWATVIKSRSRARANLPDADGVARSFPLVSPKLKNL